MFDTREDSISIEKIKNKNEITMNEMIFNEPTQQSKVLTQNIVNKIKTSPIKVDGNKLNYKMISSNLS